MTAKRKDTYKYQRAYRERQKADKVMLQIWCPKWAVEQVRDYVNKLRESSGMTVTQSQDKARIEYLENELRERDERINRILGR